MVPIPNVERRVVVVLVVAGIAMSAAGFGLLDDGGSSAEQSLDESPPDPPTVTPQATDSPPEEGTPTSTTTTSRGNSTTDGPGSISVSLSVEDPADVQNVDGDAGWVGGEVSGTVNWTVDGERNVTVLVHTWDREDGWIEVRRTDTAVNGSGTAHLEDLFDRTIVEYVEGAPANAFDNDDEGTTTVARGYVSVTAFFSTDDGRNVRDSSIDDYAFTVTNLEETASTPALSVSDSGLFDASTAAPGQSGTSETVVSNVGDEAGELDVALTAVESGENGLIEPEQSVDSLGNGGELDEHLLVRIALVRDDGSRTYVIGGPSSFEQVDALEPAVLVENYRVGSEASVRVLTEWRVPADAGNEIQSDRVSMNASYVLTST